MRVAVAGVTPTASARSGQVLWSTRREDDERPVLGEGDLFGDVGQRTRRDRHEHSTGREDGVEERRRLRLI